MPLILDRQNVQDLYAEASERQWVLPAFNAENRTTCEAILAAAKDCGQQIDIKDLPIIIGITNNYWHRPQAVYYTHTRRWDIGMRLFLADLHVLTAKDAPFSQLRVMIHLDHIQWDQDEELLGWDMHQFSSIMFDASTLPFAENIARTAEFREKHDNAILIEGACDEIAEATESKDSDLTTPEMAEQYYRETGVDILVANLGTEHRATAAELQYHGELAREITNRIGPRLCLHGTSSVSADRLTHLFSDGIRRVNVWTALERDSSPALLRASIENAAKIVGPGKAKEWLAEGLLGAKTNTRDQRSLAYYTTKFRQDIIFQNMKRIVTDYLRTWYC